MSKAWMPLFIGDYLGDTGHLNQGQHGAYILFLMHYWQNGPIPADKQECYCIARAMDEQSRCNADAVLRKFFHLEGEVYRQGRSDIERDRANASYERRASAAKSRWNKDTERKSPRSNASALVVQSNSNPSDSDSIDSDLDLKVLEVAKLYPGIADPLHLSREHAGLIVEALVRHGDKVLDGSRRFLECYQRWPAAESKFRPSVKAFFEQSQYMFESSHWDKGKKKQVPMVDALEIKKKQMAETGMTYVEGKGFRRVSEEA